MGYAEQCAANEESAQLSSEHPILLKFLQGIIDWNSQHGQNNVIEMLITNTLTEIENLKGGK